MSAAWFPTHAEFRRGLGEARARGRRGATVYAVLGAAVLTFRDADTNVWLAEVRRASATLPGCVEVLNVG